MIKFIRHFIRALVPRGLWEAMRAKRNHHRVLEVEKICLAEMVCASSTVESTGFVSPVRTAPLRSMLLIADVMWEMNELVPELQRICEVNIHDVRPALRSNPDECAKEKVLHSIAGYLDENSVQPDVILLYLRGNLLTESLFDTLRKHCPCPILGMNLDDKVSFWDYGSAGGGDHYQKWAKYFDVNITNSKIAESWYRIAGANGLYVPPAMKRAEGLSSPNQADFSHVLSFVGSPKVDRATLIERLRSLELPVSVFGKGWKDGQWVTNPVEIYRSSQINLGLGMATPHFSTTKNRDFECPGSGACYLTTYNWELCEWWDIGREILCYRNEEELIEMACWYRNRPDVCLKIAQAAWLRGNAEHTWEVRFRKLFHELGFSV